MSNIEKNREKLVNFIASIKESAEDFLVDLDLSPKMKDTCPCDNCKHDSKEGYEAPCCDCVGYNDNPGWEAVVDGPDNVMEPCLDCKHECKSTWEVPCDVCTGSDDPIKWEKVIGDPVADAMEEFIAPKEYKWECMDKENCEKPCVCIMPSYGSNPSECLFDDRKANWSRV